MTTAAHRDEIIAMWQSGLTLQGIGDRFGVTRERVRQLLRKWNLAREVGGASRRAVMRSQANACRRDMKYMAKYGCGYAEYKAIPTRAKLAFRNQRKSAYSRGIAFSLTLAAWWNIWIASGKWEMRGRCKGQFVMSRVGDMGGYTAGNVYITTTSVNSAEGCGWRKRNPPEMRGIFFAYPNRKNGWLAKVGKKHIGLFPTADAARVARQQFLDARAA